MFSGSEEVGCFSGRYAGLEEKNVLEAGGLPRVPKTEPMKQEERSQKRHN